MRELLNIVGAVIVASVFMSLMLAIAYASFLLIPVLIMAGMIFLVYLLFNELNHPKKKKKKRRKERY